MTDRLPVRKMNPVHGGTWAGIDVGELLGERKRFMSQPNPLKPWENLSSETADMYFGRVLGIDAASIRRLAGEGE